MIDNDIESGVAFPAHHKMFRAEGDFKIILTTPFEQLHEAWPDVFNAPICPPAPIPRIDSFEAAVRGKYPEVKPTPATKP